LLSQWALYIKSEPIDKPTCFERNFERTTIMNILVTHPTHLAMAPDGSLWSANPSYGYQYWSRYLSVFDKVRLCTRMQLHTFTPDGWTRVDGPGITAQPVPDFRGPTGYAKQRTKIKQAIIQAIEDSEAIHLTLPCTVISGTIWHALQSERPYGVNVISDPYDTFAPGAMRHPLRAYFRIWYSYVMRQQCRLASAALYVTQTALQRRYPCPNFSATSSNIDLPIERIRTTPRTCEGNILPIKLIFVGTMAQLTKGPDVLIDALALCVNRNLDVVLTMIGDGKHRLELERRAEQHNLRYRTRFLGQLPNSQAVFAELDRADIFVLPSRQEGLPRAMIEAMARGLPCIGTQVGGIPELLASEDLVPPNDPDALAQRIYSIAIDAKRRCQMSARNLSTASLYELSLLKARRDTFFRYLHDTTATWLAQRQAT
jgi:glycosyltransferase involved in cell wall biosynthesis